MNPKLSRRRVLIAGVAGFGAPVLPAAGQPAAPPDPKGPEGWPDFPHDEPALVAEIVGKSHSNEARVRELIGRHPALVNAAWDWGFGDWETPLGAASHVGQRAIAEFLIERGARIDLFAAAMLGLTDVVRAFVAARPGAQRLLGPHGIPLLAHARAGGDKARDTVEYLASLGDAGVGLEAKTLDLDQRKAYAGVYTYGEAAARRFEIKLNPRDQLVFADPGGQRNLHALGNHEFFPAGVHGTRFLFDLAAGTVVITAGPRTLRAKRV